MRNDFEQLMFETLKSNVPATQDDKTCNEIFRNLHDRIKGDLQTIFWFSYLKAYKLITLRTKFKNL